MGRCLGRGQRYGKAYITPRSFSDQEATVDVFLDKDSNRWRMELLKEILLPVDVDRVRLIPVSRSAAKDERVWAASEDGCFRVRDLYSLALQKHNESSCSTGSDPIWKYIYGAFIFIPKPRFFYGERLGIYSLMVQTCVKRV